MNRRSVIRAGVTLSGMALTPWPMLASAAAESPLIYLSPLKRNGELSRCQAEVWFASDGDDFYVVTANDAWRARAVSQGLTDTQVWVGDVGMWKRASGKYRDLPAQRMQGSVVVDPVTHARLLTRFGDKYSAEWGTWGPRFKNGLADGSRVMLRYAPA